MAANGISTFTTKQLKLEAKLAQATAKRQGKTVAIDGTITGSIDATKTYYRAANTLDIDLLPTKYDDNALVDNRKGPATGITPNPDVSSIPNEDFDALPPPAVNNYTIPGSDVVVNVTWGPNGPSYYAPRFEVVNGGVNHVAGSSMATAEQFSVPFVDMGITGAGNWTWWVSTTSLQQGRPWVELTVGLYRRTYTSYHNDDPAFFATATQTEAAADSTLTVASTPENTSIQWLGYFVPATTETYTFFINSDDGSYLWIGTTAASGYTTSNALTGASYLGPGTGTISLTAGEYYPIRLLYGNGPSGGGLNLTYAHTGQTATNDFTGRIFYNPVTTGF